MQRIWKSTNSQPRRLFWPKTLSGAPRYIFDGADADLRPCFLPDFTRQPSDLFHKILKFLIIGRIPVGPRVATWLTGYDGWDTLKAIRPTDCFMADGITNLRTLRAIAWMLPREVSKFNYFNNCLRFALPHTDLGALTERMRRIGFQLATFDPDDARQYRLLLTEQFYRNPDASHTPLSHTPSAFFCGEDKGRRKHLESLQQQLRQLGINTTFIIVERPEQRITYEEYLNHLSACHLLVDWVQADQAGITRRPVEALFWQKKLITNHHALIHADFYHPDNIFIIGHDRPERLSEFIRQPFKPIPDEVRERYHVNHWLTYWQDAHRHTEH